jgi:hypothetical protein
VRTTGGPLRLISRYWRKSSDRTATRR